MVVDASVPNEAVCFSRRSSHTPLPHVLEALVSCFPNAYATDGRTRRPLLDVAEEWRSTTHAAAIESLRHLLSIGDRKTYDAQKPHLPAVTVGGTFAKRENAGIEQHSGLVMLEIDFDRRHPELLPEAEDLRDRFAKDPCIALAVVSVSGAGVRVALPIPHCETDTQYKYWWDEARRYLQASYGVRLDKGNDIARLWFATYDPGAHINPSALCFPGYKTARLLHSLAMRLWRMQDHERDVTRNLVAHTLGGKIAGGALEKSYVLDYFASIVLATTQHPDKQWRKFQGQLARGMRRPIVEEARAESAQRRTGARRAPDDAVTLPWRDALLVKKNGDPTTNVFNIGLILANHVHWNGRFWWDAVRAQDMIDDAPLSDAHTMEVAQWLGRYERLSIGNVRMVQQCIEAECQKYPRDLLQIWLNTLPAWDGISRLDDWLADVAGVQKDAYGMAVSRIIPLSMVARAMQPGCLYRYVVIFEGLENTGKSSLVRAIAGDGWHVELSIGLESKEAHMMIKDAWVAEMPELDSLSRTEETRLKAFITLQQDAWIPKYSNLRTAVPRRCIFIGTTNEDSYLKGQSGNTRFLPIQTGHIDVLAFLQMRKQLFAEAVQAYHQQPDTWWQFPPDALAQAEQAREARRVLNVYEDELADWLGDRTEITWREVAEGFLQLSKAHWENKSMQMQVSAALKTLGWKRTVLWRDGRPLRLWCVPSKTW